VSNLPEIKERLDRLTKMGNSLKGQFTGMTGPEGEALKKKAKKEGTRIGIGAGASVFGLLIVCLAMIYSLAVVILLVNIALDRLWLSALIVVGGFIIIGGIIIAVGAGMAHSSAKELSKTTSGLTAQLKSTGDQMKAEAEELQKLLKKEAEERQKQMMEMMEAAKQAAPVAAPAAIAGLLALRWLKKRRKQRKEQKAIFNIIEAYEEAKAEAELD
jgi:Putative Actinobacterial Holin-X, holin superfamily III